MQAILPILALSLYFTDVGDNDDNDDDDGSDSGDGGDMGRVTWALLFLAVGRYSIQVSWMWMVFYLNYLYHDIPLDEENSHGFHDFPRKNIWFDSWTSKECFFDMSFRKKSPSYLPSIRSCTVGSPKPRIYPCIYGI